MTTPRRWARRAVLSVLAGSGLTAAGIGGPLAAPALGAEAATGTTTTGENPSAPAAETTPQTSAPEASSGAQQGAAEPTNTTSTATTPSSTSATPPAPVAAPAAPAETPATAPTVVVQRKQQITKGRRKRGKADSSTGAATQGLGDTSGAATGTTQNGPATVPAGTPNGVAPAPQAVGGEAGTLASLFASSAVSAQALDFYRVPLFLLPVYRAAAIQYDVPWQILAAINEVETDYGTDQSVSTAGAVGWMQFMPATWQLYGVDATDSGYADPYNPVDAIFAAARYLHAAGASHHLHRAILAYNHSQAYVEAVLLRARLIAGYPNSVIATLTGLVNSRLPTIGAHLAPGAVYLPETAASGAEPASQSATAAPTAVGSSPASSTASSATAGAVPASPLVAGAVALHGRAAKAAAQGASVPGATPAPPPQVLAARAEAAANAPAKASQLVNLVGKPGAAVVAVQAGRVMHLGHSHALGRYLVLRDVYGDIFTYAGLGSIAPRYRRPASPVTPFELSARASGSVAGPEGGGATQGNTAKGKAAQSGAREPTRDPTPPLPASAGHQPPLTLKVKAHAAAATRSAAALAAEAETEAETTNSGGGKVRLYARPENPLARSAAARAAKAAAAGNGRWLALRSGSLVAQGTVLGHLDSTPKPEAGRLRFAVRPAGDSSTVDPQTLLANWRQLGIALHPAGSKGRIELLGATAADVFPMSKSELQRSVLSDPGMQLDACARHDVAAGAIDRRVLAVLEFLSRNGLQPTVSGLRCARAARTAAGARFEHFAGNAVDISAINGIPIAGHQGPGSLADATIRTLLTLPHQLAPRRIVSLMHYPEAATTFARTAEWDHIHIGFGPLRSGAHTARTAAANSVQSAPALGGSLSKTEWSQLIDRIAALPQPTVIAKPSSSAIRDPQAAPTNQGLGASASSSGS